MTTDILEQIQKLAFAPDIYKQTEEIGKQFGLHIDQVGELDGEIRDIFLGKRKSSGFLSDIVERLEINNDLANKIAEETNKRIFRVFREKLKTGGGRDAFSNTLERIGGFSVERPDGGEGTEEPSSDVTSADKDSILSGIEDPEPARPSQATKTVPVDAGTVPTNLPVAAETPSKTPPQTQAEAHTEPLVDQLLMGSVSATQQKVIQKPKMPGVDPYREPIK